MNNAKSRLRRTKRERQNNNRAHFNMFFRELDHLHHALSEAQSNLKHNRVAGLAQPLENLIEVIATLIAELQLEAQDYGQELTQDHEFIKTIALEYSCFEWVFQQENVTANSNQIKIYPPIIKNDETIANGGLQRLLGVEAVELLVGGYGEPVHGQVAVLQLLVPAPAGVALDAVLEVVVGEDAELAVDPP